MTENQTPLPKFLVFSFIGIAMFAFSLPFWYDPSMLEEIINTWQSILN